MDAILAALERLTGREGVQDPGPPVAALIRAANAYPVEPSPVAGASHALLSLEYPEFASRVKAQRARLAGLLSRIVDRVEPGTASVVLKPLQAALAARGPAAAAGTSAGGGDYSDLYDFLDRLRESAETFIDEAKGQHSSQQVAVVQGQLAAAAASSAAASGGGGGGGFRNGAGGGGGGNRMPQAKNLLKPQLHFDDAPIDNARDTPFIPRGGPRYHSAGAPPPRGSSSSSTSAAQHPYAREIAGLAFQPWQLARADPPAPFAPLDDVELMFVSTPAGLAHMVDYLEGAGEHADTEPGHRHPRHPTRGTAPVREIAIDLEAHSLRSFQGFTCLLQLSSRGRDFLVDTLALRSHMHLLNRVTTHAGIVKVLHGCDSDVVWLQRDFGVWLVNVFDTGQAARVLAYPSFGLAYLLQRYAGVTANKEFQTADWRERPLPPALLKYAREDTHYLLGIYDRVRNELVDRSPATTGVPVVGAGAGAGSSSSAATVTTVEAPNLLAAVLARSNEKALSVYDKERWEPTAYRRLMVKLGLKPTQGAAGAAAAAGGSGSSSSAAATPSAAATGDDEDAAAAEVDEDGVPTPSAAAADGSAASAPSSPRTSAFAALYDWRDAVARAEDESTHYVLPNRLLARLAELRPPTVDALVRACNPIPPLVRQRAAEVVQVIVGAKSAVAAAGGGAAVVPAAAAPAAAEAGTRVAAGAKRPADSSSSASTTAAAAGAPKRLAVASAADDGVPVAAPAAVPPGGWLQPPALTAASGSSVSVTVAVSVTAPAAGGKKSASAAAWDSDDDRADGNSGGAAPVAVRSSAAAAMFDDSDDDDVNDAAVAPASLAAQIRASMAGVPLLELLGVRLPAPAPQPAPAATLPASAADGQLAPAAPAAAGGDSDEDDADHQQQQPAAPLAPPPDLAEGGVTSVAQRFAKPRPAGAAAAPRAPKAPKAAAPADGSNDDGSDEGDDDGAAPAFDYDAVASSGSAAAAAAGVRQAVQAEAGRVRERHGRGGGGRGRGRGGRGRGGGGNPYMR